MASHRSLRADKHSGLHSGAWGRRFCCEPGGGTTVPPNRKVDEEWLSCVGLPRRYSKSLVGQSEPGPTHETTKLTRLGDTPEEVFGGPSKCTHPSRRGPAHRRTTADRPGPKPARQWQSAR